MRHSLKPLLLLCIFATLILTGCPNPNDPADTPEADTPSFIRTHAENDDYYGFTEIYFDNYEEMLSDSNRNYLCVQRKKGDSNWKQLMFINSLNEVEEMPVLIDYYTDPGTTYSYRFYCYCFGSGRHYSEPMTKTASAGLGEIQLSDVAATYDETTGMLTFTTPPVFTYTPIDYFTHPWKSMYFSDEENDLDFSVRLENQQTSYSIFEAITANYRRNQLPGHTYTDLIMN